MAASPPRTSHLSRQLDLAQLAAELQAPIGLRAVVLGTDALDDLTGLVPAGASVALLTDGVAKRRGERDLLPEVQRRLPGLPVTTVVLGGPSGRVHADEVTLTEAAQRCAGVSWIVTVGSGTLADIGKAVSARLDGAAHVVVQTATSVNGFADDQSVLLVEGVKRTTRTRWPDFLIADADVLAGAPAALNVAGVGDLLAMFTAPADWRLAHMLGMADSYSAGAVALARRHGPEVLSLAPRLAQGDPVAATKVAEVLAYSGISMGVAATTAPASGMEHTVSHLIEMAMNRQGQDSAFHGAQVGVSTVLASALWSRVRKLLTGRVRLEFPSEGTMEERVREAFADLDPSGAMGGECWRLYSRKLRRWTANRRALEKVDWRAVDQEVAPLLGGGDELAGSLGAAGAPARFSELDPAPSRDLVRWALATCHLMRDRFTVADLAFFTGGWGPEDVDSVLGEAASLGGGL
jgi:glycerol-1-phosphate dehydrogenase [NAD(P)+]